MAMTEQEYQRRTAALDREYENRLDALGSPLTANADAAMQVEEWLCRSVDTPDREYMAD